MIDRHKSANPKLKQQKDPKPTRASGLANSMIINTNPYSIPRATR